MGIIHLLYSLPLSLLTLHTRAVNMNQYKSLGHSQMLTNMFISMGAIPKVTVHEVVLHNRLPTIVNVDRA